MILILLIFLKKCQISVKYPKNGELCAIIKLMMIERGNYYQLLGGVCFGGFEKIQRNENYVI